MGMMMPCRHHSRPPTPPMHAFISCRRPTSARRHRPPCRRFRLHHHRISSIFKRYLFRGKPRETAHHMRRTTGTGNGGGGAESVVSSSSTFLGENQEKTLIIAAGNGDGQWWRRQWVAAAMTGEQPRQPPSSYPLKRFRLLHLHLVRNL